MLPRNDNNNLAPRIMKEMRALALGAPSGQWALRAPYMKYAMQMKWDAKHKTTQMMQHLQTKVTLLIAEYL